MSHIITLDKHVYTGNTSESVYSWSWFFP